MHAQFVLNRRGASSNCRFGSDRRERAARLLARALSRGTGRGGLTGGFLYDLGVVSYTIRIPCILNVSCMYFDVSRSDTF